MIIKDRQFFRQTSEGLEPYMPIMVSSLKPEWIYDGDKYYYYAKKFGLLSLVNPSYLKRLREYLLEAWGENAVYTGISSPIVASKLELPFFSNLTQNLVRDDRLSSRIDIVKLTKEAELLIKEHPKTMGWNIVEPAWEALATGNDPSFVAKQIIEICKIYKTVAPHLPIIWKECGSYHKSRYFQPSTVGIVFNEVMSSQYCPEVLGANCYPINPKNWSGPSWWNLVTDDSRKPKNGVPLLGISECGWQPNQSIEPNWDEKRAKRLGVGLPSQKTMSRYAPVSGTDQRSAYNECFERWIEFNKKAISQFGVKFISWHSACGHGGNRKEDGTRHWTPWGPIDGVSDYWHPAEEVRKAVKESLS